MNSRNNLGYHFVLLILLLFSFNSYAQNTEVIKDSAIGVPSFSEDFLSGYHTGIKIVSAPFKFDEKDWIITGSVLSASALAYLLDEDSRSFWKRNQNKTLDEISKVAKAYGEISYAAIFSGSLYLGGKLFKNKNVSITGRMLLEGLFYAGLTSTIIKTVSGRSRPYTNDGYNRFKPFQTEIAYTSFPSGHVTVAFTLSSILSSRIDNDYATIGLYALASSTFMQRMYSDSHWFSDTVLAAAIGYFIGKAVVKFDDDSNNNISFTPYLIPNGAGVSFSYSL
uniref:Phosphatase PAP2 family protein n=1 Tax=Ignavibacterium album TaxID=591197 RepID=A0A7V2ZLB7_9BACT